MKIMKCKIYIIILTAFLVMGLAACGTTPVPATQLEQETVMVIEQMPETEPEPSHQWTIEELGAVIVAAGEFWEDWWNLRGVFEHIEWVDWDELPEHITATRGFAFGRFLPASGFESLDDISNYLSRYYTADWVNAELSGEFASFIEYDGILYVDGTRAGFPRPDWETAKHILTEQDGSHILVETAVLWGSWHREPYDYAYPWEVVYHFTFVDGKINIVENPYGIFEEIAYEASHNWNIEELGLTIVRAGWFWEDWWSFSSRFLPDHIDWNVPSHIAVMGYARLLPSSGFESLDEICIYLSRYYTESWIEREVFGEFSAFIEYEGELYIYGSRVVSSNIPRPNWGFATHILIEQDGSRAVVETTVLTEYWDGQTSERQHIFTFADGRIDRGLGPSED
ncbi:MAG: IseA DL-endopeptidase inhibitor family protein [Defluviitaleaceae bacterium]|nr:IseA DL-endopeptidase inhibitor family protein [Defluviitaleaceae bacterium]